MKKIIIALSSLLLLAPLAQTYADRRILPFKPHVKVFEPNQNAMIAWNGKEEILLLTTDLKASEKTKAIEALPLPSEPLIKKGDPDVFKRAVKLINSKTRRWAPQVRTKKGAHGRSGGFAKETPPAGEVTFHDKIGSQDISVTHVLNKEGFVEWVEKYLKSAGADNPQIPESLKEDVEGYMQAGFTWFVFDVVELGETIGSTEAIQYRFATKSLFYPLKISSSMEGDSRVKLLALTGYHILLKNDVGVTWIKPHTPIAVTALEANQIDRDMAGLFESGKNMMLRIWEFTGSLASFKDDVIGHSSRYSTSDESLEQIMMSKSERPLIEAVRKGDLAEVRELLDLGMNVNRKSLNTTALHQAADAGSTDMVKLLLDRSAEVNTTDKFGATPLMQAVEHGRLDVVKLLIKKGANVNIKDLKGQTALLCAARIGNEEEVVALFARGAEVNVVDKLGMTPLMQAVKHGRVEVARMLIKKGADVNAKDLEGQTALQYAHHADRGYEEGISLLLTGGAGVNVVDKLGVTPLMRAVERGRVVVIRKLIKKGADVSRKDATGQTALHYAAKKGYVDAAQLLVQSGADVNAKTSDEKTALQFAAGQGHTATVKLLKSYGGHE